MVGPPIPKPFKRFDAETSLRMEGQASDRSAGASAGRTGIGDERRPWLVAVLGILTGGLYLWYWLWTSARDAESFDPRSRSPFRIARWAVPTQVVGVLGVWTLGLTAAWMLGTVPEDPTAAGVETMGATLAGLVGGVMLFALVGLVGAVASLVALWRLWSFVERHERALRVRDPLTPGTMLALVLGLFAFTFVPLLNLLVVLAGPFLGGYILHRTQKGLNRVWAAARDGYEASQARGRGGSPRDRTAAPASTAAHQTAEGRQR